MNKNKTKAQTCAQLIKNAKHIAVLTGAGISTNAGIPDFRGPQGLYITRRYDPEKVFDIEYFHHDPVPFFNFARDFVGLEQTLNPTFAHQFFAQLENQGKLAGIVTQNIDSLHHRAGSKKVFEMHGSFWQSSCLNCDRKFSYEEIKLKLSRESIPKCDCSGVIKPDVVFFGEAVKHLNESQKLAAAADLFFVVGTSCAVYPAAMIPTLTQGEIVIVNKGKVDLNVYNIALAVEDDIDAFFTETSQYL